VHSLIFNYINTDKIYISLWLNIRKAQKILSAFNDIIYLILVRSIDLSFNPSNAKLRLN